jgi:hypothetical protein
VKPLLALIVAMVASTAAHAHQWYYVNMDNNATTVRTQCVAIGDKDTLDPTETLMDVFGASTLKIKAHLMLPDGSLILDVSHGNTTYAFRDSIDGCLKTRVSELHRTAKTEGIHGNPQSGADSSWYLVAPAKGECVLESSTGPGLDTPEAMASFETSLSQRVHVRHNPNNPDIAEVINDTTGGTLIGFVRGADHCEIMLHKMMAAEAQ